MVLACATARPVRAIHVDHGLRSGSENEAAVVDAAAIRFGARFEARTVAVPLGPNLEARARAARYDAMPAGVLTGHTADDQAETVLLNVMRGAGLDGLAGMRTHGHPILSLRRAETHALCAEVGLVPLQDPTNASAEFTRNRVRHELIPLLDDIARREVTPLLARQATRLHAVAELLDEMSDHIDPSDARSVATAPPELAARALRRWLRVGIDDEQHPPDAKAIERVLAVATGKSESCDVVKGVRVVRSRQRLSLVRTQ